MKILLHTCCAPCSIMCIEVLKDQGIIPDLFWYNPNIHPYTEYRSRKNALTNYAESKNIKVCMKDDYGLKTFINNIYPDFDNRCEYCYRSRLEKTAQYASEHGYGVFSTTLLISPYQKHDLIYKTADKAAKKFSVEFLYYDFRPYFREGQALARQSDIYMQKYCGCIFSEEERYLKTKKEA